MGPWIRQILLIEGPLNPLLTCGMTRIFPTYLYSVDSSSHMASCWFFCWRVIFSRSSMTSVHLSASSSSSCPSSKLVSDWSDPSMWSEDASELFKPRVLNCCKRSGRLRLKSYNVVNYIFLSFFKKNIQYENYQLEELAPRLAPKSIRQTKTT